MNSSEHKGLSSYFGDNAKASGPPVSIECLHLTEITDWQIIQAENWQRMSDMYNKDIGNFTLQHYDPSLLTTPNIATLNIALKSSQKLIFCMLSKLYHSSQKKASS